MQIGKIEITEKGFNVLTLDGHYPLHPNDVEDPLLCLEHGLDVQIGLVTKDDICYAKIVGFI